MKNKTLKSYGNRYFGRGHRGSRSHGGRTGGVGNAGRWDHSKNAKSPIVIKEKVRKYIDIEKVISLLNSSKKVSSKIIGLHTPEQVLRLSKFGKSVLSLEMNKRLKSSLKEILE